MTTGTGSGRCIEGTRRAEDHGNPRSTVIFMIFAPSHPSLFRNSPC